MSRLSRQALAQRAGVPPDLVGGLVEVGVLRPGDDDASFSPGTSGGRDSCTP